MKIMKTKIKTSLAIFILATIGLININATIDKKKVNQTETGAEKLVVLNVEVLAPEMSLVEEALLTAQEADAQVDKYTSLQIELIRSSENKSDAVNLDELYTAESADLEIERYAAKQVELMKTRAEK
jgi:hypothetical protein